MANTTPLPGGDAGHEVLEGQVAAVLYQDEASGFAVVSLASGGVTQTAAGSLAPVHPGEQLRLHGQWTVHPRFGRQFKAAWSERRTPTTQDGLERYLGSGAFPGIGPDLARQLVQFFGEGTLAALEAGEKELQKAPGIGPKRAGVLAAAYRADRERHRVLAELRGFGLSGTQALQAYDAWQAGAVGQVQRDPYVLIGRLPGVGFETAEKLAQKAGIPRDSLERARGLIPHLLREAAREGHACLPREEIWSRLESLGLDGARIGEGAEQLAQAGRLRVEELEGASWWYLPGLWQAETELAADVHRLRSGPEGSPATQAQILAALRRADFQPDDSQRRALEMALHRPFSVLTGGPGTGKTTTLRLLLDILESCGCTPIRLASPTGRAARRLREATGREASTIHRLLGFDPRALSFRHNRDAPLEASYLIVDEVSMLDLPLAHALLQAVPGGCRVLLVGDADQLPSVGPGAVLRDLVACPEVPSARLQRIHRQSADSGIVEAAHAVLEGRLPQGSAEDGGDFFVSYFRDPRQAAELVERIVCERIPKRFALDPRRDVLVLSPMYRGPLGVDELNQRLGRSLNPQAQGPEWASPFRAGDRVMVVRNDYEREVFNGDTGRVVAFQAREMVVEIDGELQLYKREQLGDLVPAWCVTVHRAQGSEARAAVVVLDRSHYLLLRRNLLYTALTRGRELVCLVADPVALRRAVANAAEAQRHGGLRRRLVP